MTDSVPFRWDLTQFGAGYQNWAGVVAFFATKPNHVVLCGGVYDDSCSFAPTSCGKAYYDLLTVENRTLENKQDTFRVRPSNLGGIAGRLGASGNMGRSLCPRNAAAVHS